MKFFALFICFYFSALTALPTVRVVKEHFVEKCNTSKNKNTSKSSATYPTSPKEKCLLNLTFNGFNFLVFTQNYVIKPAYNSFEKMVMSVYHKNLISYYKTSIWQPPEFSFLIV